MKSEGIRLTQYSHGAGCGCKIAPDVLSRILAETDGGASNATFPLLLVGHQSRDDAAAVALDSMDPSDLGAVLGEADALRLREPPIEKVRETLPHPDALSRVSDSFSKGHPALHWSCFLSRI